MELPMIDRRSLLAAAGAMVMMPSLARAQGAGGIVATTGMIADSVARVTGQPVTAILQSGVDPHTHRPTRTDILAMTRAEMVVVNGLNLEAQFTQVLDELRADGRSVVVLGDHAASDRLLTDPAYPDQPDPHVWMDPLLWADIVTAAPLPAMPGAEAFRAEAARLDAFARAGLATIAPERRLLVTAHDAFGYLGRAYGIEVMGVQGISTESEAGLQRIAELVDLIVSRSVPAVFVESSVSDRSVRALVEGAAARGHEVAIGGELFSDAMGPDGSYEGTWIGMMDHNLTTIIRALGGTAPAGGMDGRLAAT
jgi:manganese/zinc/iron transport system substrate-binding protein